MLCTKLLPVLFIIYFLIVFHMYVLSTYFSVKSYKAQFELKIFGLGKVRHQIKFNLNYLQGYIIIIRKTYIND